MGLLFTIHACTCLYYLFINVSDSRIGLVSFPTKSACNIESGLHRKDFWHNESTQGREYFNNQLAGMEGEVHGTKFQRTRYICNGKCNKDFCYFRWGQPFGEGLVTIVVPQLRRGENSLLLWNTSNLNTPIYTFVGHTDVVLEFQWRYPKTGKFAHSFDRNQHGISTLKLFFFADNNDYELITWSKDQCLRIFKIDPFLKKVKEIYFLKG